MRVVCPATCHQQLLQKADKLEQKPCSHHDQKTQSTCIHRAPAAIGQEHAARIHAKKAGDLRLGEHTHGAHGLNT